MSKLDAAHPAGFEGIEKFLPVFLADAAAAGAIRVDASWWGGGA